MEIELDKAKLYFEIQGNPDNPPLVLWHGAGCTLRMWDLVVEQLKEFYFTIAFDVRGAGKSINRDLNEDAYSFKKYSEDLNLILDFLNVDKVHLWSMAWGTRAAIAYSSLNPNKILSATFSDASIEKADINAQKLGQKKSIN
jgi:pimeloyl-ACP methyl ester carboxylesterase